MIWCQACNRLYSEYEFCTHRPQRWWSKLLWRFFDWTERTFHV